MEEKRSQLLTLMVVFMLGMAGTAVVLGLDSASNDDPDTETEYVYVEKDADTNPVASMYASDTNPYIGDEVSFDASASQDPDGEVTNYLFDFDDGSTELNSSQAMVTHIFEDVASFEVTLKVLDSNNSWSENEMIITITVQPLDEIDDINPSHRSLESEEEAEEMLEESPLAQIPEIPVTPQEQNEEEYDSSHVMERLPTDPEYEIQTPTPENRPTPDYPDPDFDLELDDADLEDNANGNKGIEYAEAALDTETEFTLDLETTAITQDNFDQVGENVTPVRDIKANYRKTAEPEEGKPHQHTAYKTLYAVDAQNYDNDTDGNPEFASHKAVSYQMVGHREMPVYESFYVFNMVVWDNNSDGNPEFVKIEGFGYESYDGNGDGNVEFAYVKTSRILSVDKDSDGQANYGHVSTGEFMKVDRNSDGTAEATKGDFKEVKIYNNGSTEHANYLGSKKWGFVAVNAKNNTPDNNEYALVYGETFIFINNDTTTEAANFARYEFFSFISIDLNDDGVPGRETVAYEKWMILNRDSDENINYIGYDKIFISHNGNTGKGFLHAEKVRMFDNDSNSFYEYQGFEKSAIFYRDQDDDGTREFEGLHYQGIKIWDNATGEGENDPKGDGNPDYATAGELFYYGEDKDSDGEKEKERFILNFYVLDNDDSDGTSGEFMVHYDSGEE